jgi:RNA polymerase sigma factor (sigma-70 family)
VSQEQQREQLREQAFARSAIDALGEKDRAALLLREEGLDYHEIAATLGIGEDTVKQHVSRILMKLKVNDRAQATAEAIRRGLVQV